MNNYWHQPFKANESYYNICIIRNLPNWMNHLVDYQQDNIPQTIIRLLHAVSVRHTKCHPSFATTRKKQTKRSIVVFLYLNGS